MPTLAPDHALLKDRADRIEAALRLLPTCDNHDLALDPRTRICAEDLALFRPLVKFWENNEIQASRSLTVKEISNIEKLANNLKEAILTAHKPAIDLLGLQGDVLNPSGLSSALSIIAWKAANADVSPIPENAHGGAPKKDRPQQVARRVAEHYISLTGFYPTISNLERGATGPFLTLLNAVFTELGWLKSNDNGVTQLSMQNQGRKAIEWLNQTCPKYSAANGENPPPKTDSKLT